jgi:hypothetical protein
MRIPAFDMVVLGILIVFAIAWPVFFAFIRRGTRHGSRKRVVHCGVLAWSDRRSNRLSALEGI